MSGKALMVQGTSSWAGKSLVATALCRHFARRGFRVAPFKAQNMSNNARVVEGGEIGTAQYLQALAAGIEPDVRMNPVLVKPEADTQSQVVLRGVVDHELSRRPWRERPPWLWRVIEESLQALLDEYELLIIEGAGSPAEINLRDTDLANMQVAERAKAPVILVSDINLGGAFAHLYGTWALLEETARARIAGFVLNKFRGDASLLSPGPEHLEELAYASGRRRRRANVGRELACATHRRDFLTALTRSPLQLGRSVAPRGCSSSFPPTGAYPHRGAGELIETRSSFSRARIV